jgi:Fic family protein
MEGVVEMMLDASRNYGHPLSADHLFGWHASLSQAGRIARAIVDMALAQSEKGPNRFHRISEQIGRARNAYNEVLEKTQKGPMDVTPLEGFEGKLTTSKYAKLAKCSPDTALRDVTSLVELGVLRRSPAGGRTTSYSIAEIARGEGQRD